MRGAVALLSEAPLDVGGVETHLLALLRGGVEAGYVMRVVAPARPRFVRAAAGLGVSVNPWHTTGPLDPGALCNLLALLKAEDIDLLHIHGPRAGVLGRLAAWWLGIPVLVTVHMPAYHYHAGSGPAARLRRWLYREVERFLNHWLTERLIYVSSSVHEEALALGVSPGDRSVVIQNGVNLGAYQDSRPATAAGEGTSDCSVTISYVGRLEREKGVDLLLTAMASLRDTGQGWRLWLIGDGPQRPALEQQAKALQLDHQVHFLGFRPEVPAI